MNNSKQQSLTDVRRQRSSSLWRWIVLAIAFFHFASCSRPAPLPHADYVPIAQLEQSYGRLITVSNSPTPDQNGTGDRLGLFKDASHTIWGIPLTADSDGSVLGCVPSMLREAPVSDILPPDTSEIVGAMNEPTGWRGGTGKLELLLRNTRGVLRWHAVASVEIKTGSVCWSQSPPRQLLKYYRLVIAGAEK